MKKILLLCLVSLTLIYAKDSVKFNYAEETQRKHPTSQDFILSYNNVLEKVRTSVVNISTQKTSDNSAMGRNPFLDDPFFREFFRGQRQIPQERIQRALGSGVIVSSDGYIVTNNHVVDGADVIKVSLAGDKKEYEAKLIGKDKKSDLAIIKIDAKNLNAVTFYNSDNVKVGDVVFALGNPFGVGETITQGIVSATGRSGVGIVEYEDFIQTDASINPGNSGGALINSAGQLIGINSAIISKTGGNVGIGFAIPSNMVTSIATELVDKGKFTRAYLGVSISDVSEDMRSFYDNNYGALVTSVTDNSPAAKVGIKRGDLIIEINGKKIDGASELKNTIGSYPPSKVVSIKFLRDKKVTTLKIKLGSLDNAVDSQEVFTYNGISVKNIDNKIRETKQIPNDVSGVIISKIDNKSQAYSIGLREGDIIIQIENYNLKNIDEFSKITRTKSKKRFYIYRQGSVFAIVL